MKLTEFSVGHPVSISMGIVILVGLGFISIVGLPIEMFPEIEFPAISVTTEYEGVAPQEIEERVTKPIEQAVAAVEDVKKIHSATSEGFSQVMIEFHWGSDTEMLRVDVREKLDAIRSRLPDDIEDPVISRRTFGSDPQAIRVAVSSETLPFTEVRRIADDVLAARLETIDEVATVEVRGGLEREIHVDVLPRQLESYDLTLADLVAALRAENLNNPGGRIDRGRDELLVRTVGKLRTLDEIRSLAVASRDGAVVTVGDVAEVADTHAEVRSLSRHDGRQTVELAVLKEPQGNALSISDAVRAQVDRMRDEYPQIRMGVAFDSSPFIRDAVLNVQDNASWGAFFAILVLWPFLSRRRLGVFVAIAATGAALLLAEPAAARLAGPVGARASALAGFAALALGALLLRLLWRSSPATLIVSLAMPISIVATFILIKFAGLSLNVISLGGLALGVGMLVDNSVVVIENVARHLELGKEPRRAAVDGASEVALAIIVSTLTTLAVFLPIAWVEGIAREVFTDLSLTVTFSLATSLFVSITIVPMMAAKFLRRSEAAAVPPAAGTGAESELRALHRPQARFRGFLLGLLESRFRRAAVLGTAVAIFLASLAGLALHPRGFFPAQDRDTFAFYVKLPRGTAFDVVDRVTERVERIIRRDPAVESTFASVRPENTTVGVTLRKDRERHAGDVQSDLRRALADIPDADVGIFNFGGGGASGRQVQVELLGEDLDRLAQLGEGLKRQLESVEGALDVRSSLEEGRPELRVEIDRRRAADLGLSVRQVADAVETAMDGRVAGRFTEAGDEVDIRVQYAPAQRSDVQSLRELRLRNASGVPVTLRDVARVSTDRGPVEIRRIDQRRMVSVDAERDRHVALSSIAAELGERMEQVPLPVGYTWRFSGDEERRTEAFAGLGVSLVIAVALIYMIMAALFESLVQPFVIMLTLPLSLAGVYGGLVVFGQDLSVPAFVGVIMLMGIVVNNAIVLIDYVNRLRRRGLARREAIALGSAVRLRPILMTAGTTVLGMLPLALGIGRGSVVFQALAAGVVGGLAVSTLLTLLVVPCAYDLLDRIAALIRRAAHAAGVNVEEPFPAASAAPEPVRPVASPPAEETPDRTRPLRSPDPEPARAGQIR